MTLVREIVSTLLKERQQANIPVRQPLSRGTGPSVLSSYAEIIKEEVNIKIYEGTGAFNLDTKLTPGLKTEGDLRELVRGLQDVRKKAGLTPSDMVKLTLQTDEKGKELVKQFETELKKIVLVSELKFTENNPARNAFSIADAGGGEEIKIDKLTFRAKVEK